MGKDSAIEWTHHTFNPWWGCVKVSPGCEHCYAETLSKRVGQHVWGPAKTTGRRMMSADYWRQPLKWNAAAERAGERKRVFCASMADVFEDHPDVEAPRRRLFELILTTPALDWLLLTKRPENITSFVPAAWLETPPINVWYGTSVENQEQAERRIPHLLQVPAAVRFLSCEPLLGPLDFDVCEDEGDAYGDGAVYYNVLSGERWMRDGFEKELDSMPAIHWVIAGGESGHGARPMHPDWVRSLRDQCVRAGVAFHFKQWGEFTPYYEAVDLERHEIVLREYNNGVKRVGKKAAGRLLEGRTWDEYPAPVAERTRR